jgi:hypothetical protein
MTDLTIGKVFESTFGEIALQGEGTIDAFPWLSKISEDADMKSLQTIWECIEMLGFHPPRPLESKYAGSWHEELEKSGLYRLDMDSKSLCEAEQYFRGLVSLDGDYRITEMPREGEVSIDSRVLHLRMKHFGLFPYPVDDPFGAREGPWEYALRFRLGIPEEIGSLDLANLLGDMESLWAILVQALQDRPFLIIKGRIDTEWPVELLEKVWAEWENRLWTPGSSERGRSSEDLREEARNQFGARTLQLLLWINGHCQDIRVVIPPIRMFPG